MKITGNANEVAVDILLREIHGEVKPEEKERIISSALEIGFIGRKEAEELRGRLNGLLQNV